jgi:hypothetical protein
LGRFNREADADLAVEQVTAAVKRLREMSPLYEKARAGADGAVASRPHETAVRSPR